MGWIGKIMGGTIGFALGGPVGAILGGVFGHAFDTKEELELAGRRTGLSPEEQDQMVFFVTCFSMLAKLAAADGRVSKEETETINRFMTNDLSLTESNKQVAARIFNEALNSTDSFDAFALQFYGRFRDRPELIDMMLDILVRVSVADGVLSDSEEKLILSAVSIFHYSETAYNRIKERYLKTSESVYAILKCSSNDPDEKIKSQYRKLVAQFHPDKIAAKGLPEEFIKFATDKFREIHDAYETIRKERGF